MHCAGEKGGPAKVLRLAPLVAAPALLWASLAAQSVPAAQCALAFASLTYGAMIPYWFSAMTMKSVGQAANEMVREVARQFREIPGLLEGTPGHGPPDHARCIAISTDASLREMVAPAVLVMSTPLLFGIFLFFDNLLFFLLVVGRLSSLDGRRRWTDPSLFQRVPHFRLRIDNGIFVPQWPP